VVVSPDGLKPRTASQSPCRAPTCGCLPPGACLRVANSTPPPASAWPGEMPGSCPSPTTAVGREESAANLLDSSRWPRLWVCRCTIDVGRCNLPEVTSTVSGPVEWTVITRSSHLQVGTQVGAGEGIATQYAGWTPSEVTHNLESHVCQLSARCPRGRPVLDLDALAFSAPAF
jgi:hypothetical protein